MAEGPFKDAGLGMFGNEKSYIAKGMGADDKNGGFGKLLALLLQQPAQNPYALQQGAVPPAATGQGLMTPAVPGGIGMNPQNRSGMGLKTNTGLQAPAVPTLAPTAMPQPSAATVQDIDNNLNSFWGVQ
jgi:hypothetical protein